MADISNPHDSFFKELFSRPDLAADFLQSYLPEEVAALLDLDPAAVELTKDSFVDPDLSEHYSDLLYRVRLRDGRPVYAYVLAEHKSYVDPWVALQVLCYMVRIWERDRGLDRRAPLVPIIPIVLYHGRTAWRRAPGFGALFEGPEALRRYWPDFEVGLTDLSLQGQAEIRGQAPLRLAALVLRHALDEDAEQRLSELMAVWVELPDPETAILYLAVVGRYLSRVVKGLTEEIVQQAAKASLSDSGGERMTTFIETWLEERHQEGVKQGMQQGVQQGVQQGLQQGLQEGIRTGLLDGIESALNLKFGAPGLALMPEIREIEDADVLRAVLAATITAHTPQDVRAAF